MKLRHHLATLSFCLDLLDPEATAIPRSSTSQASARGLPDGAGHREKWFYEPTTWVAAASVAEAIEEPGIIVAEHCQEEGPAVDTSGDHPRSLGDLPWRGRRSQALVIRNDETGASGRCPGGSSHVPTTADDGHSFSLSGWPRQPGTACFSQTPTPSWRYRAQPTPLSCVPLSGPQSRAQNTIGASDSNMNRSKSSNCSN